MDLQMKIWLLRLKPFDNKQVNFEVIRTENTLIVLPGEVIGRKWVDDLLTSDSHFVIIDKQNDN